MKRILCLLLICIMGTVSMTAQENKSEFLFDEFQDATVFYRDGRQFMVNLNYNLIGNCFLFKDVEDDNNLKEFAYINQIAMVKTGDRTFLISRNGKSQELLQMEPQVLVEYKGKVKDPGKRAAYGGRSETSAITSISSIQSGGQYHKLEGDRRIVYGLNKTYQITHNKKEKLFSTQKQFLKIFPEQKETLEQFIKENNIDFQNPEQVVTLVNYADALH